MPSDGGKFVERAEQGGDNAVFISGFGVTFYKQNMSATVPECSTNHFLPRPFHS